MAPPLSIKDRMPSIFGWLAECNSFGAIHKVLMNNHGKNGIKLGLIRGTVTYPHPPTSIHDSLDES
jgi:hypothetical protein